MDGNKRRSRKIARANKRSASQYNKRVNNPLTVGRLHGEPKMVQKGDKKIGYATVAAEYPKYKGYKPKGKLKRNVPTK